MRTPGRRLATPGLPATHDFPGSTEQTMAAKNRRILVTGVARWWGALLVQRLVEDPTVAEVIGIDTREPRYDLGRADYLKLAVRHSLIGKRVRAVGIAPCAPTMTAT